MRQKSILLSLVKAVKLVDEEDRGPGESPPLVFGFFEHLLHLFHPGKNSTQGNEMRSRSPGDHPCNGGFPDPRRTPEDQ